MTYTSSSRQRRQERHRSQKVRGSIVWFLVVAGALGLVFLLVWNIIRPPQGEQIPIQGDNHISTGSDPGPYNSNPPSSGPHYAEELPRGFYEEADLAAWNPFPEAYAVHNLEHGYIVFWYNCQVLDEAACAQLKAQIRDYMENPLSVPKLVALPWEETDLPLVLTSWGYRLEMPVFDAGQATAFINANRLRAPEPNAP